MDWLVDGWQQRTQQKLAFAGCTAALLAMRSDPLRSASKFRDFLYKLAGYGTAAVIFSGIQETCRAARGRHDFLNSALSGAVTGALVVGHYQGPKYRLLGLVTWGSLGAVLHVANSVLQPRHLLEDYLVREGLLSPEATRNRHVAAQRAASEAGLIFPEYEHRDILLAAKAIKERELRAINDGKAAAATAGGDLTATRTMTAAAAIGHEEGTATDIDDDDPGYQAWLRVSGFEADALLQAPPPTQQQQRQVASEDATDSAGGAEGASRSSAGRAAAAGSDGARMGAGMGVATGGGGGGNTTATSHGWTIWLMPWKWRLGKRGSSGAVERDEEQRRG